MTHLVHKERNDDENDNNASYHNHQHDEHDTADDTTCTDHDEELIFLQAVYTCLENKSGSTSSIRPPILHTTTNNITQHLSASFSTETITKLDLYNANLSSLPSNLPTYLPNLSILFCMKNQFTTVPEVIGKCPKLQMVSFKSNRIRDIHPLALNAQLRWLILTDNQLTSIPSTIGNCTGLQKLMLSGNLLESLPAEISNCHALELIRLASNRLIEPPMALLNLPNLSWVAFSGNPFLVVSTRTTTTTTNNNNNIDDDTNEKQMEEHLTEWKYNDLDDPSKGVELGKGASGITRKYTLPWTVEPSTHQSEDDTTTFPMQVAVKEYYSDSITSDGNPQEERKISMMASSLGCQSLIQVLGKTPRGNLIMELLTDYRVLAGPPSLESCSRDVYEPGMTLSIKQVTAIVEHLLYALMKLHQRGICHGDFYGHNVLISNNNDVDENRVWLTDFGAAFVYDTASDYGKRVEATERRAFGHFVREISNLMRVVGDEDDSDGGGSKDHDECERFRAYLEHLANLCAHQTFDSLYHDYWRDRKSVV